MYITLKLTLNPSFFTASPSFNARSKLSGATAILTSSIYGLQGLNNDSTSESLTSFSFKITAKFLLL